jgi:hypothetical protein
MIRIVAGHIGIFGKKRVFDDDGRSKRSGSAKPRRSLIDAKRNCRRTSAAEEQPQQNDHRYRHAEQPEQKSSSHVSLHEFDRFKNAEADARFRQAERKNLAGVPAELERHAA